MIAREYSTGLMEYEGSWDGLNVRICIPSLKNHTGGTCTDAIVREEPGIILSTRINDTLHTPQHLDDTCNKNMHSDWDFLPALGGGHYY